MGIEFDRYAQEGNAFINELSRKLGHESEKAQVGILLRAVLHTLRDRITVQESFNLLAQLPMFLKAVYVENWKYKPETSRIRSVEEFEDAVEREQRKYGETRFNWNQSTIELAKTVLGCLGKYLSGGEMDDIIGQLPAELKQVFEESVRV